MSHDRATPRRPRTRGGRAEILDAAADMFADTTLDQVAGFIGPRTVAAALGRSSGTVTHHFPGSRSRERSLRCAAAARALDRVGMSPVQSASAAFIDASTRLGKGDGSAVDELAAALVHDMLQFSPDAESDRDVRMEAEEVALCLAVAVAPRDEVARHLAREFCRPMREEYEKATEHLLLAARRRWVDGMTGAAFALLTSALCDGFVWLRRFDRESAPVSMFADAWMRLFHACTAPEETVEDVSYRDVLVAVPPGSRLDPAKRGAVVRAAHDVYRATGWRGLTMSAVAETAGVSRAVVVANLLDRNGLAAAVWARHVPSLHRDAERDAALPVHLAVRATLERLVRLAREDMALTAAFLEGVFAYTVKNGTVSPDDPVDPRNLVPLPSVIAPVISANARQFRPGFADTPGAVGDTAAQLVNSALHLAMTRPGKAETEVAARVVATTMCGMLRRRPPAGAD